MRPSCRPERAADTASIDVLGPFGSGSEETGLIRHAATPELSACVASLFVPWAYPVGDIAMGNLHRQFSLPADRASARSSGENENAVDGVLIKSAN